MRFEDTSRISKLMVMGSSVCNLNCSYCYLHDQHKNNAYVLLNKEIQQAWKDGTYVENIKKTFKAMNCDINAIWDLEIWGGEPLIMVNNLINPIRELILYLPNVSSLQIPTNFTRINSLIDFLEMIDKTLTEKNWDPNKERYFYAHIQISMDTPDHMGQEKCHSVKWDVYKENIKNLFKQLNERPPFDHVQVCIEVHPTMPKDLIFKYLGTEEGIVDYLTCYHDFHKFIIDEADKYKFGMRVSQAATTSFPHIAVPAQMTVEEAYQFTKINLMCNYIQEKLPFIVHDKVDVVQEAGFPKDSTTITNGNLICLESGLMGVTIMPDGTLAECPSDYILYYKPYWDWISKDPLRKKEYRCSKIKQTYYINPITATEQEKEDYDWYLYEAIRLNTSTGLHMTINLCLEMALSGQIDSAYLVDLDKLLKNMYDLDCIYSCPREQIDDVQSPYLASVYNIRRMLNGLVQVNNERVTNRTKNEVRGIIKWKRPQELAPSTD